MKLTQTAWRHSHIGPNLINILYPVPDTDCIPILYNLCINCIMSVHDGGIKNKLMSENSITCLYRNSSVYLFIYLFQVFTKLSFVSHCNDLTPLSS